MAKWISERAGARYEVFGRGAASEALTHIGSLTAPNEELAKSRARMMYAERDWIELTIAPAGAFLKLIGHMKDNGPGFA